MDNPLLALLDPFREQILSEFRQIVREEIAASQSQQNERMLSPAEALKLFEPQITRPTLDKLCKDGKLSKNRVGSRVYFKYSELLGAIKGYKRYEQAQA